MLVGGRRAPRPACRPASDTNTVSDELWGQLAERHTHQQLLELIVTAGWYRTLAYVINAARIPLEAWAARFPKRPSPANR